MNNSKNTKDNGRKTINVTVNKKVANSSNSGKSKKTKKKKHRKVMKFVISTLLILIILAITSFCYLIQRNGGGLSGLLTTVLGESKEGLENLETIQILVLGVSGVDDYKLADTIMVASYNPKTQAASLMSIPRDTYVGSKNRRTATQNYIASYKINSVYRNGTNIPEMMERINSLTGLELSNYVVIDTTALIKLVDAIGGVTFDVPIDMDYDDSSQNLVIDLKAGEQLIDGSKAEQLLRFRHNNDGSTYPSSYGQQDLGRMKTQREFITATLKQTLRSQNILKIKDIIDIMSENITTNLDFGILKKYVPYAVEFDVDNLNTGVVPGDTEMCNGVSIYVADAADTKTLVEELFPTETSVIDESGSDNTVTSTTKQNTTAKTSNTTTESSNSKNTTNSTSNISTSGSDTDTANKISYSDIKIQVINGSGSDEKLTEVVKLLKNKGYKVSKQGTSNAVAKTSIINRTNQTSDVMSDVKDLLGTSSVTKGTDTASVDITIIIGKDY